MKKILFHSLTIPPDNVSTGMLVAEIADGFKELGVDVEILASSPQYNIESSKNLTSDKYYTSSYKVTLLGQFRGLYSSVPISFNACMIRLVRSIRACLQATKSLSLSSLSEVLSSSASFHASSIRIGFEPSENSCSLETTSSGKNPLR